MRALQLVVLGGCMVASLASCQVSRPTFVTRTSGTVTSFPTDSASTVLLLHDSQGPQATRAIMTTAEAAAFRQQ
ncbi:hypothetical protein [Hymenobacter sp. UYP22]|uniref:hypothetical protein n=1 Tax=Hymenobacter sp. UYP22 TaxID=3156348 RepID=UPI00339B00C4